MCAVRAGDYDLFHSLWEEWIGPQGASGEVLEKETEDMFGVTLLMQSAWNGWKEEGKEGTHTLCRVLALLASRLPLNSRTEKMSWTALMVACREGAPCQVRTLLDAGPILLAIHCRLSIL